MAWQISFSSEWPEPPIEFEDQPNNMPFFGLSVGSPFDISRMPTRGRITSAWSKPIPDIFRTPGLNGVSQKFFDLVEKFEPKIHQFFPLKLTHKNGSRVEPDYYIFNCAIGIDAILFKKADPQWALTGRGRPVPGTGMDYNFELSRPAIAGHHLWCGKCVGQSSLFVSDEFYDAMQAAQISNYEARHREELNESWVAEENILPLLEWKAKERQSF